MSPETASILIGQTKQFTAVGKFADGNTVEITEVTHWSSSNTALATINAGIATGTGHGTTTITASLNGVTSDPATLTVVSPEVASIAVSPDSASIAVGQTKQFTATGTYPDGSNVDVTLVAIWASSDTEIATIDEGGLATGIGNGTAEITAKLSEITSSPAIFTVTPAPKIFSWGFAGGIIGGVLLAGLVVYLLRP